MQATWLIGFVAAFSPAAVGARVGANGLVEAQPERTFPQMAQTPASATYGPQWQLYYTSPGGDQAMVGKCPWAHGCNAGKFWYSADADQDGVVDCITGTRWRSWDDLGNDLPNPVTNETSENMLDYFTTYLDAGKYVKQADGVVEVLERYAYLVGPPLPAIANPGGFPSYFSYCVKPAKMVLAGFPAEFKGALVQTLNPAAVGGGSGDELFVADERKVRQPASPRESSSANSNWEDSDEFRWASPFSTIRFGDLDRDSDIDLDDVRAFIAILGMYGDDSRFPPDVDMDGDRCITAVDGVMLYADDGDGNGNATVLIDGCDSGVANSRVPMGCSIRALIALCDKNALDHLGFVTCVSGLMDDLVNDGTIDLPDRTLIEACAAASNLPLPPADPRPPSSPHSGASSAHSEF